MAEQVIQPKSEEKTKSANKPKNLPQFNVVLLNDDDHTYEYVVGMLRSIFGYTEERGFQLAKTVDQQGRAIVMTTHKERAELKRDQILSFGTDSRVSACKGSMSAVIEPVN